MELPQITSTISTTSAYALSAGNAINPVEDKPRPRRMQAYKEDVSVAPFGTDYADALAKQLKEIEMADRIVKVYIADINENIPSDKRILHTGAERFCDLTDQELFFEVPIAEILKKHNEYRVTLSDKKVSEKFGRDVKLEPVRIKDLKMVVVTVAQF